MNNHLVVNCFGGPGAGKTVAAAELFIALKKKNVDVNFVGDFAQECILEGNADSLQDQIYIFGNTYHRLLSSYMNSLVTVTDAPIMLNTIYQTGLSETFNKLVLEMHERFNNVNILLERKEGYNHSMMGRVHSLSESVGIDRQIETMLDFCQLPYIRECDVHELEGNMIEAVTSDILVFLRENENGTDDG